jgi:outer membrane receptor protein involved in Fe transport
MTAAAIVLLLSVAPQAAAPLSGTIRSVDGAPIEGATVTLHQGERRDTATSDAAGAYTFAAAALPAVVEVTARAFAPASRLVDRSPADFSLAPASVRESVVVTAAAATSGAWRDGSTGQTRLSREDLERQPAVTPDEALRVLAGFSLFRRSSARASNPTTHGVTMRGLSASGASRGLVLLDGVPLNEGFGGWVTWTRVPPDAIEGVDVARGAEGDLFGSDALGGVIGFRSRSGTPGSLSFSGEAGSHGLASLGASAGGRQGRWSLFGAAGWLRNDGVIPLEAASRGAVDRPSSAEWENALGRAEAAWGARRLAITAWGGHDYRGNGTEQQWNRMQGGTVAVSFDALVKSTMVAARVSTGPNRFDQTLTAVSSTRATETFISLQTSDTMATRALVEIGHGVPDGYVVARATLTRASTDFTVARPAEQTVRSLADDTEAVSIHAGFAPLGEFTVGVGARHEWRAAPEPGDARRGATVGHVSGAWHPAGPFVVRGSIATSHRWPTLNELARNFQVGNVLTLANDALQPERARSGDIALAVERRRWGASVAGFWNVVEDAVANVTLPTAGPGIVRQRQNAGEAHATGVEFDAEVRPTARFRVRASAALVNARFRHSLEPALEGNRLPQVPRGTFSLFADASLPRAITASLVLRTTGSQFDDDRNVFTLARGTNLDARIAGRLGAGGRVGWHVVVENAFDARVEVGRTPLVTLAPGRAVRAGVSWRR